MADYLIKIHAGGKAVQDAEVTLIGIGTEDSDRYGKVSIPVPVSRVTMYRGSRYANRKGKAPGDVTDEAQVVQVRIRHANGEMGTTLDLTPDVETEVDIGG